MPADNIQDVTKIAIRGCPLFTKAQESLKCAREARKQKWYNSAASRLYYALFQACKELFVTKGDEYKIDGRPLKAGYESDIPHGEIENIFYRLRDNKTAILINHIYTKRDRADYKKVLITEEVLDENDEWNEAEKKIKSIAEELQSEKYPS